MQVSRNVNLDVLRIFGTRITTVADPAVNETDMRRHCLLKVENLENQEGSIRSARRLTVEEH
jgi:hypothetical protein